MFPFFIAIVIAAIVNMMTSPWVYAVALDCTLNENDANQIEWVYTIALFMLAAFIGLTW